MKLYLAALLLLFTLGPIAVAAAEKKEKDRPEAAKDATAPDISQKAFDAAWELKEAGKYSEAEEALRALVAARTQVLGAEDIKTLRAKMTLLALELRQHVDAAVEARISSLLLTLQRVAGAEDPDTLKFQKYAITAKAGLGRYAEAEQEYRKLISTEQRVLGPENEETLYARGMYGLVLMEAGKLEEAEKEFRELLGISERVSGAATKDTQSVRYNLALVLMLEENYAEAEPLLRGSVAACTRLYGPEHPETLQSRNALGGLLSQQKKQAEAEKELRSVTAIQARTLGPEHPDTLMSRGNWANELPLEEAVRELRTLVAIDDRVLGPEDPETLRCCYSLTVRLGRQKKYLEALPYAQRIHASRLKLLGKEHAETQAVEKIVRFLMKALEKGEAPSKPAEDAAGVRGSGRTLAVVDGVAIRASDLEAELQNQPPPTLYPHLSALQTEPTPEAAKKGQESGNTSTQQALVKKDDNTLAFFKDPHTTALLDHYAAGKHSDSILPGSPWMRRALTSPDSPDLKQAEQELARQKHRTLEKLIDEQLLLNEFHRLKGIVKQDSMDEDIEAIVRKSFNGDHAAFRAALAQSGTTPEAFRAARERLTILSVMRARLSGEVKIGDDEQVRAYYEKHPQRWRSPEKVKLHTLTLLKLDDKTRAQMEGLRKRIASGADFAETARAESQDSHAEHGGAWDWTDATDLSESVRAAIAKLKPGALSGIIDQDGALILVRVDERRSPAPLPFEKVKDEVTQVMEEEEREKHLEINLKSLREAADIQMMDAGPV